MIFPNLPTDSIAKMCFYGGILIFISAIFYGITTDEKYRQQHLNLEDRKIELTYQLKRDSALYISYEESKSVDSAERVKAKLDLWQDNQQINLINNRIKVNRSDSNDLDEICLISAIFGIIIFLVGLFGLAQDETSVEPEVVCQSCIMPLSLDLRPHKEQSLCSECFDGEKYTEPDLTFEEMKLRLIKRCNAFGLNERKKRKHIKRLKLLNRWQKQLYWDLEKQQG